MAGSVLAAAILLLVHTTNSYGQDSDSAVDTSCPATRSPRCQGGPRFRPADGSCSHRDGVLGMSGTPYRRVLAPAYADGVHAPRAGLTRRGLPSPREVVNLLHLDRDRPSPSVNHFFMNWGQLVAHDVTLLDTQFPEANSQCCREAANRAGATDSCQRIDIPSDDPFFRRHGVSCLGMQRSGSQTCGGRHHEQRNMVTHFLDASFVYGSDESTARRLRAMDAGLLRFRNINGEEQLPTDDQGELLAGDARVAVTAMLTAVHTTLMREHNRLARALAQLNPHWDDERLYQEARRVVVAQWQLMTYRDWLPRLIGAEAVDSYGLRLAQEGYGRAADAQPDPRTANDFATAAFRSFHSLIQNDIWLGRDGRRTGTVVDTTGDAVPRQRGMLLAVVEGMLYQRSQDQDQYMADQIKNRMFSNGRAFGGDLVSTDIARGRDHGLPGYNAYREECGPGRAASWAGFGDRIGPANVRTLQALYAHPDDVDYYVGGLLERLPSAPGATITSPVFQCVVADQFRRYRDGDHFFFDQPQHFTPAQLQEIRKQTASRLMCDNVSGLNVVPRDAFVNAGVDGNSDVQCSQLPAMDLSPWREHQSPRRRQWW